MDCRTAQLLIDFARPQARELPDEDLRAFEDHVAGCPDCSTMAANERRIDEHLGKAMRAVEVPDTLRSHLLNRLDAERNDWYKHWAGHGMRIAVAAAACLLLVVGGAWGYSQYRYANRPEPNLELVKTEIFEFAVSPPDRVKVEKWFKEEWGIATVLPDLKYKYLTTKGEGVFQGQKVPQMVFNLNDETKTPAIHENAVVYVLSDRHFKLSELATGEPSISGYAYNVSVLHQPGGSYAYIIVHTGNTLDWLVNAQ